MSELLQKANDGILTLTLNRPEKRNALTANLIGDLKSAILEAEKDESLRAIVIRGAGDDFCSGADLSMLQAISQKDILENLDDATHFVELFLAMRASKLPIIGAVHGRALAGGCGLATACDLVVATNTAKFGYPEVRIGFVPAIVMAILRRNISEKRAFDLVTRGVEFSAKKAKKIGLISEVFDETDFETELARFVAPYLKISRSAVMLSKKLLYQMDGLNLESALTLGAEVNAITRLTEDCQKGIQRFVDNE